MENKLITMINLLPPKEKVALLTERNLKITVILMFVLFSGIISFALLLFLIDINLRAKLSLQEMNLEMQNKEFESLEVKQREYQVGRIDQMLVWLNSFEQEKFYLSEFIAKLSTIIPSQLDVINVSYCKQRDELSLSGFAPTRELLLGFKKKLEKEGNFQNIYFPPSTWMSPADINFSVRFNIY